MAQKNFKANTRTSLINWTGKKLTGLHRGTIQISSGTIIVESGEILSGNFDIDISSLLVTDIEDPKANAQLAGHLFGDDFFAIDRFPTANFTITNSTPVKENIRRIDGLLTIKGITQALSFDAAVNIDENSLYATGEIVVDRTKYDIKFRSGNFFKDLGDSLIHNDFILDLNLVANLN